MATYELEIRYEGPSNSTVISRSKQQWQRAAQEAEQMENIPSACFDLAKILHRTPALPDSIGSMERCLEGYSTWRDDDTACKKTTKTEKTQDFGLRSDWATNCATSSSHPFVHFNGQENNGIAFLVLGWAYILSADLAERQRIPMKYEYSHAEECSAAVCLDYATARELAWWKAVTARGSGWTMDGQLSPWAIAVQSDSVGVLGATHTKQRPPTAIEAARYLARLCRAYDLGTQCTAALAVTLSIPLHASRIFEGPAEIELPTPSLVQRVATPLTVKELPVDFAAIGRHMALSLNPFLYGSVLWGTFWSPDVPCNLAGAWLRPIGEILLPYIRSGKLETFIQTISFSPVAPLWLGVVLCGKRGLIRSVEPYLTRLVPFADAWPRIDAAAWTGQPQSFMHLRSAGLSADGTISRADIWRLRHDFHDEYDDSTWFQDMPPYGWPPFGRMSVKDVEPEIRSHLKCSHQWRYAGWTWTGEGVDSTLREYEIPYHAIRVRRNLRGSRLQQVQSGSELCELSRTATQSVFEWCISEVEEGFGGKLVRPSHRPDDDEQPKPKHELDDKAIEKWRESCQTKLFEDPGRQPWTSQVYTEPDADFSACA